MNRGFYFLFMMSIFKFSGEKKERRTYVYACYCDPSSEACSTGYFVDHCEAFGFRIKMISGILLHDHVVHFALWVCLLLV